MIFKYDDFLLENILNESILYATPDLEKILKKIDSDISNDLLNTIGNDIKPDITLLDLDKDDYLTFASMKNFTKNLKDEYGDGFEYIGTNYNKHLVELLVKAQANVLNKSRSQIKIGRLVNQIFPNKYKSKDIEEFVNKFKSVMESSSQFELIEGDDIEEWYDKNNYLEVKGTLGSSCMGSKKGIFDLYTKNKNCRLLILKDDDKIVGRALVWKLSWLSTKDFDNIADNRDVYFMDRQYTISDSDIIKFKEYAKSQNWAYKESNSHSNVGSVVVNGTIYSDSNMNVESSLIDLKKFPYLDTFRTYDPKTGTLYNVDSDDVHGSDEYKGMYDLADTNGGYSLIESGIWSEWYGRTISSENGDVIWSNWADSYLYDHDAVRLNNEWYPTDCDDLCWSDIDDEYHLVDNCYWSDTQETWVVDTNSVVIITNINIDGDYIDVDRVSDNFRNKVDINYLYSTTLEKMKEFDVETSYEYLNIDNLYLADIPDINFKYIHEEFLIEVFKVKHNEVYEDLELYLTEDIAKEFGIKLDKDTIYKDDIFHFIDNIISLSKNTNLFRGEPIIKIEDIVERDYPFASQSNNVIKIYDKFYEKEE